MAGATCSSSSVRWATAWASSKRQTVPIGEAGSGASAVRASRVPATAAHTQPSAAASAGSIQRGSVTTAAPPCAAIADSEPAAATTSTRSAGGLGIASVSQSRR